MPSNGQHSFLQLESEPEQKVAQCVNALERATLISTQKRFLLKVTSGGVNALERATLISTMEEK